MKVLNVILAGALAMTVAACATGPAFHPLKGGVGYSDAQLQQNSFTVSFAGNSDTSRQQVENFLLFRAAQLTVANGYDSFVVANRETDKSTTYQSLGFGPRWVGPGWYRPGWRAWWGMDPVMNDTSSVPSNSFNATATINMKKGPAPAGRTSAYNAQDLINRLGPTVGVASAAAPAPVS